MAARRVADRGIGPSFSTVEDRNRHDPTSRPMGVSVASCSSARNAASRGPSSASEYICPRDHPLRAGGTFRMRQRLHQSAATSLRSVAMPRWHDHGSANGRSSHVAAAMCVGQMSSTAAQCNRSIMSLANKDEHSWPTSSFVFRPPQSSGSRCLARRPAHAWAATGMHLYWPLNQQLTLRPQYAPSTPAKGILDSSRLDRLTNSRQVASGQSPMGLG